MKRFRVSRPSVDVNFKKSKGGRVKITFSPSRTVLLDSEEKSKHPMFPMGAKEARHIILQTESGVIQRLIASGDMNLMRAVRVAAEVERRQAEVFRMTF